MTFSKLKTLLRKKVTFEALCHALGDICDPSPRRAELLQRCCI